MITLLLHFVLLSSPRFNWINPLTVTIPVESFNNVLMSLGLM